MKRLVTFCMVLATAWTTAGGAFAGDTLADVRAKGVLVCGVKNSSPPFGSIHPISGEIVGYDVDFCKAIAKKLGVRTELKAVTSENRIPLLQSGDIDMIAATMTKNAERAVQIDFSDTYFITRQKFLARKGTVRSLKDLEGKTIGTASGSTSEQNLRKAVPSATVLTFENYHRAFLALVEGKVFAVTTDEAILAGRRAEAWNKKKFEIPNLQISVEPYGLGIRKGDQAFLEFVNRTLGEMEKKGEAKRIFAKWFGPKTDTPLNRDFRITAGK